MVILMETRLSSWGEEEMVDMEEEIVDMEEEMVDMEKEREGMDDNHQPTRTMMIIAWKPQTRKCHLQYILVVPERQQP